MKIFNLTRGIRIVADTGNTRNGFKHTANLFNDCYEINTAKICYLNRTWESYTFQSVLFRVVEKSDLDKKEKEFLSNIIREGTFQ